jgi:hypothetical protein
MNSGTLAYPEVYYSPPAWSVSAWVTRTADIAPAVDSFVTLLDQKMTVTINSMPVVKHLAISIGYTGNSFPHLRNSVVITLDGVILWVPSSNSISFELNTPVFVAVVFIMGVQASFNDVPSPYRIQLYINGALIGSAIRGDVSMGYNYFDGGLSQTLTQYGGTWDLAASTATLRTTSLLVQDVTFYGFPLCLCCQAGVHLRSCCDQSSLLVACAGSRAAEHQRHEPQRDELETRDERFSCAGRSCRASLRAAEESTGVYLFDLRTLAVCLFYLRSVASDRALPNGKRWQAYWIPSATVPAAGLSLHAGFLDEVPAQRQPDRLRRQGQGSLPLQSVRAVCVLF